jgi:hypothetical protein
MRCCSIDWCSRMVAVSTAPQLACASDPSAPRQDGPDISARLIFLSIGTEREESYPRANIWLGLCIGGLAIALTWRENDLSSAGRPAAPIALLFVVLSRNDKLLPHTPDLVPPVSLSLLIDALPVQRSKGNERTNEAAWDRLLPSHFVKILSHSYLCVPYICYFTIMCPPVTQIYINQLSDRTNTSYHWHATFWLPEKIGWCPEAAARGRWIWEPRRTHVHSLSTVAIKQQYFGLLLL